MSIQQHDDDLEMVVDYSETADEWIGECSQHGEILRVAGSVPDHNLVIANLVRHDEMLHDGDGKLHWSAWLL